MGAQRHRFGVARGKGPQEPRPQQTGGPQLGDFHEKIHADGPEKREPRGKIVDSEAGGHAGAHVFEPVG